MRTRRALAMVVGLVWPVASVRAQQVAHDSTAASHAPNYGVKAVSIVGSAAWTQLLGVPEKWPRTWRGYGYRVGDQVGFNVAEESLRFGLEAVIPWRPLAGPCRGAEAGRGWRARSVAATRCGLERTFVAQNTDGAQRPNAPLLGAIIAASAVSLAWRPERTDAHKGQLFVLTRVGIVTGATVLSRGLGAWRGK